MCCRYYTDMDPDLREIVEEMNRAPLAGKMTAHFGKPIRTEGEVRPADLAPVIATSKAGNRTAFPMCWGFTGPKALLINARSETAAVLPTFAEAWASHRCAIPASYYFEWAHILQPDGKRKTGDRYRIRPKGERITWLAGLYRMEDGFPRFTVLTREPAEEIRFIHDRMPVILPAESIDAWIRPDQDPKDVLKTALRDMRFEKDQDE